jgi:hypothetical protein
MTFQVTTAGGSIEAGGLTAAKALEMAASLARAGSNVFIAEFTEGGSFVKSMAFYTEES